MRFLTKILLLLLGLSALAAGARPQAVEAKKFPGFLGSYHPYKGTAFGGGGWTEGELLQKAFAFGENAIISQAAYNGYTFAENVENNCGEWGVNKIYGILRPPTEKGVINQPADTDLLKPFRLEPGMIQGARRFSELSRRCPQIAGLVIDDFYNDYPKLLSAQDLRDIRGALLGKPVDEQGRVDHSAPVLTPNLKLYIVVYEHQLEKPIDREVFKGIDGISFWIWKQSANHRNFDSYIEKLESLYPGKEIIAGVYVYNGKETPTPASVHHVIERSVDLYAAGRVNGLLVFSAIWLSREKSTRERWDELALPQFLGKIYYPFLGEAAGRVIDAGTRKPVPNATVTITRLAGGRALLVARKLTDEKGEYRFGGWAGPKNDARYEIRIENNDGKPAAVKGRLRAGQSVRLSDAAIRR